MAHAFDEESERSYSGLIQATEEKRSTPSFEYYAYIGKVNKMKDCTAYNNTSKIY
jgi:hypothetical protein